MEKSNKTYLHGSIDAWDEVFSGADLSYSESSETQGKLFEHIKISFLKGLFPPPPAKILEVGCGTAFVSLYFAKRGYAATCLDINEEVLKAAKENFKKEGVLADFVVGDSEKLSFKDEQFDVVTSFGLLEHFSNPRPTIKESARVLKSGGLFFADVVPSRFSCQSFGNIFNALSSLSYWTLKGKAGLGFKKALQNFRPLYFENNIRFYEYKKMIESAGIKNIQVRGNRPFPRLTLPKSLDRIYTALLKPTRPVWQAFDRWDSPLPRFWGAGLWFWGIKS